MELDRVQLGCDMQLIYYLRLQIGDWRVLAKNVVAAKYGDVIVFT